MAAILFPELQFHDENGVPLASGTIETKVAGTSTPTPTYTDSGGLTSVGNTITLDAEGRPNSGNGIWLGTTTTYKFIIKDSAGNTVQTVDNISSGGFNGSSSFITATSESGLTSARVLTTSTTNAIVDAGAGSTIQVQRTALTGDVTASANSNATTIASGVVTLAKMANIATDKLIGRDTAGTGVPEAIGMGAGLEFDGSGNIRISTSSVTLPNGTGVTTPSVGRVAIDTNTDNTNITHGSMLFHDGTGTRYNISVDTLPTVDGHVCTYDLTNKKFVFNAAPGFGGGAATSESYLVISNSAGLSAERAIAVSNGVAATDGGANGSYTINLDIAGLTEDTMPDGSADYVASYDASGSTNKKVLLQNIPAKRGIPILTSGSTKKVQPGIINSGINIRSSTAAALVADRLYYIPLLVDRPISLATIELYLNRGADSNANRVGIYASGSDNRPTGSPLATGTEYLYSSGGGQVSIAVAYDLIPGVLYYLALANKNTDGTSLMLTIDDLPRVEGIANVSQIDNANKAFYQTHAYAALPAVGSLTGVYTGTSFPYMAVTFS